MKASKQGHVGVVQALLESGANKEARSYVCTGLDLHDAMHCSRKALHRRTFGFLSQIGNTALIYASNRGRANVVKVLLDSGADKDGRNNVSGASRLWCFEVLSMP